MLFNKMNKQESASQSGIDFGEAAYNLLNLEKQQSYGLTNKINRHFVKKKQNKMRSYS